MSTLIENVAKVAAAHENLKTAIVAKGVSVPDGTKLSDMPALVEQIETGGGVVEPTNSRAIFAYDGSASLVVPKTVVVDMAAMTNFSYCFNDCKALTSLTLPAGFGQAATNLRYCFYNCTALKSLTLPDGCGQNSTDLYACFNSCVNLTSLTLPAGFGQDATNLYYCFSNCKALTSLTLPVGFGQAATELYECFYNCTALTNITGNPKFKVTLKLNDSNNLTHDSLMVIINGLQTVTTTQTLTLGTTNLAKLTAAEKKIATDKGWTLA